MQLSGKIMVLDLLKDNINEKYKENNDRKILVSDLPVEPQKQIQKYQ